MPEEITASTEGTASPSATPVDATAASSTDAGQVETPTQDVTTPAPAESRIDAGWKLEDEPEPLIPADDSDIEGLQAEPGLDPARTPGLVTAVRNAREQVRQLQRELNTARQQPARTEEDEQTLGLVNALIGNPAEGGVGFLNALRSGASPAYHELADLLAWNDSDYLVGKLREFGKLPAQPQAYSPLDADKLAMIPENLRDIAKQLPPHVLEDLFEQPEGVRNFTLERELKLQQMDTAQRQADERQWQGQIKEARTQGHQSVETLSDQYEQAHYSELSKWTPYGPDNAQANQRLHKEMVEGAFAELLSEPKFEQMQRDAEALLCNAPLRRLRGENLAASQDEQRARGLAAQFNTRLGQLIRDRVKERDSIYRDARSWREHQRQQAPQRTEISGGSHTVGQDGEPPRLGANGKTSQAWLDWVVSRLPAIGRSGG